MAKRAFGNVNWTPTATADNSALANATYQALKGGTTSMLIKWVEVYMAGNAAVTSPTFMQVAPDLVLGSIPTALAANAYDGPMSQIGTALSTNPVAFTAAGTGPSRTNVTTAARLNLGINAFGGIVRWVAAPGEEYVTYGSALSIGEASLSAFTGGTVGAINSHIIYEADY